MARFNDLMLIITTNTGCIAGGCSTGGYEPPVHAATAAWSYIANGNYGLFSTLTPRPTADSEADAEIAVVAAIADPMDSRASAPLWRT